ncbi:MAG: hypothetical protein QM589_18195 [Thermomicrobiales bacterium]
MRPIEARSIRENAPVTKKRCKTIGANGLPVVGEERFRDRIALRIPDVLGKDRARYAGKRTLVVGSGHSAMHVLSALVELAGTAPGTTAIWAMRRELTEDTFAACDGPLTEQTLILRDIRDLVEGGKIEAWGGVRIRELVAEPDGTGIVARTRDGDLPPVDEIVVATGFRPDHAIALGATLGSLSEGAGTRLGGWVDPTIVALVTLLIFEMRPEGIRHAGSNLRFVAIARTCNVLIIPLIGYGVASLFLHGQPLALTGLVIYFMAPSTDWFLGFTRLAKGNSTLGAALIPINMVSQLALYPVYLHLFAGRQTGSRRARSRRRSSNGSWSPSWSPSPSTWRCACSCPNGHSRACSTARAM